MQTLIEKIERLKNPTVAGLDPTLAYIPDYIKQRAFEEYGETAQGAATAFFEFNKGLIDELCGVVPAIKPQCAYYEALGWQGMKCLADTIAYAHEKGMYVINDGKRNDIGSTMTAYACAHLGETTVGSAQFPAFGADALTVNGYLGTDGIKPLLAVMENKAEKAIFVLVKTSNPSSGELQDQPLGESASLYEAMGALCESWGEPSRDKYGYSQVGAVVGATWPEQLCELRKKLPHTFFLVPGYGAQGGGAKDVAGAFDKNGRGAIINSSRAIMTAWQKTGAAPQDFAKAARIEAERMRDDISAAISQA